MFSRKFSLIFVIYFSFNNVLSHPPCGLYGAPPCQFVPAPPGHTPSCARPGKTYCEHIEHYPKYLIKHLVHKWGYESKNLIIDETGEEFESLNFRQQESISHFYDPTNIFGPPGANHLTQFEGYKYDVPSSQKGHRNGNYRDSYSEPIFIPKPRDTDKISPLFSYLLYSSITSPHHFNQKSIGHNHSNNNNNNGGGGGGGYHYGPKSSQYNPADWLKRYARDLSRKREIQTAVTDELIENNSTRSSRGISQRQQLLDLIKRTDPHHRAKRQSVGRSTLCQATTQFITPQAALNSKGNWMYVVNEMDTARQLVKAETCASQICSNLCQLPNGYNSKCEQKYVQKRLVALNGNGENLYTDTFWFPSCCVCTLSN